MGPMAAGRYAQYMGGGKKMTFAEKHPKFAAFQGKMKDAYAKEQERQPQGRLIDRGVRRY